MTKNRKQMPRLGYLRGITVDIPLLLSHLEASGLLNYDHYRDIQASSRSGHRDFVVANQYCKDTFFKEDGAASLEGEDYVQLYLTDLFEAPGTPDKKLIDTSASIFSRTRRLDPHHPSYVWEADEFNYGKINDRATGYLLTTLREFPGRLTRVRLACLRNGFSIKPHVDYDPSYICRFHIPLITNPDVKMVIKRGDEEASFNLPADGKVYYINSGLLHWVDNRSEQTRLHLIIDVQGPSLSQEIETVIF